MKKKKPRRKKEKEGKKRMSKICILGDTHIVVSNDSPFFLNNSLSFFKNKFFPYLKENSIKTVIHLGDVFDRRKFINLNTLNRVRNEFLKPFYDGDFELHCILGNHDVYYRNTNRINSLNSLLDNSKVRIYNSPTTANVFGYDLGFIPWITSDNEQECLDYIQEKTCNMLFGHIILRGYEVMRGVSSIEGNDPAVFSDYERVFSGHFHCKQESKNIFYVGTPYQLNFSDLNEVKGFHVFDLNTKRITFIENENKIFKQVKYNDQKKQMLEIDFSFFENSFVKVIVENKSQPYTFERFMENLNSIAVAGIDVVEESMFELSNNQLENAYEDTLTIINKEIDDMTDVDNKQKLKKMIHDLYVESLTL